MVIVGSWDKTNLAIERLRAERKIVTIDGKEYFNGRRVIGRDTPLDNGVYIGEVSQNGDEVREAITVDFERSPRLVSLYYDVHKEAQEHGAMYRASLLRTVYDSVAKALPTQTNTAVQDMLRKYSIGPDGELDLNTFLENGIGVCRHDSLACGVLLERFKKDGVLRGSVSVDRNGLGIFGSHAWCRYTTSHGSVWILDVRQNFFGSIEESKHWLYRRPEEQE